MVRALSPEKSDGNVVHASRHGREEGMRRAACRLGSLLLRATLALVLVSSGNAAVFAAKASLNAYFPVDFKDAAYQKATFARVQKTWSVSKSIPAAGKKAVVRASIGRDGKLIAAVVHLSSGVKEWDAAALTAVKNAAPFAPLPRRTRAHRSRFTGTSRSAPSTGGSCHFPCSWMRATSRSSASSSGMSRATSSLPTKSAILSVPHPT